MNERFATRVSYLFALSRTPHAVVDLSAPALAALLWINRFPHLWVVLVGLVTTFAAYTAVYALNDLVDYRRDQRRIAAGCPDPDGDLDASLTLHPVAIGCLSFREALVWTGLWGVVALAGAYILNPVCALIFLVACLLEVAYCVLAEVTPVRTLIAGMVKSAGPVAAILAVDPGPAVGRLLLFFVWLYLWEIGGQNIPNDWADVEEDRKAGLRTVPVVFTPRQATLTILTILFCTVALSTLLPVHAGIEALSGNAGQMVYAAAILAVGGAFLLAPGIRLTQVAWYAKEESGESAVADRPSTDSSWAHSALRTSILRLFNRASYYPFGLLIVVVIRILVGRILTFIA